MQLIINYTALKKKYNNLTDSERDFIKLTALAIETVDLSGFSKILRLCNMDSLNGIPLTQKLIQKIAKGLIQKKLLVHETMTKFRIDRNVHRFIFKETMQDERLADFMAVIRKIYPKERTYSYSTTTYRSYQVCLREMQFALANKDVAAFEDVSNIIRTDYKADSPIPFFFTNPFEKEFLDLLPEKIQAEILKNILTTAINQLKPLAPIEQFLENAYAANPKNSTFRILLGTLYIYQGKLKDKDIFFENGLGSKAWVAFLKGENDNAIYLF